MAIDSVRAGMAFRQIRKASQNTQAYQVHTLHTVQPREVFDPSLTNQHVYGNRPDWFISAATTGFIDVDLGVRQGARRFIPLQQAIAITKATELIKTKSGMNLY